MLQVRVRRPAHGEPEVEVEPESMSASPSRQLVAEMMIMAGEVIGDLGQWPAPPALAMTPISSLWLPAIVCQVSALSAPRCRLMGNGAIQMQQIVSNVR